MANPWDNAPVSVAPAEKPAWEGAKSEALPAKADFMPLIKRAAETYGLDPLLLWAQIKRESRFIPTATSKAGAQGLMQLMPATAKMLGVTDPFDPEQNVMAGARYMRQLLDRPDVAGDYTKALRYYVGGFDPKNWGAQTAAYPNLVMGEYRMAGGKVSDPRLPAASNLDLAANAALPFVSAPELMIRAMHGKLPDLSVRAGEKRDSSVVGQKIRDWWNTPGDADMAVSRFRDSIAKRKEQDPWGSLGLEAAGSLPGALLVGQGVNKLIEGAAPAVRGALSWIGDKIPAAAKSTYSWAADNLVPSANFLLGKAGYGAPGTREGASLGQRLVSNAANGLIQGAAGAAATSNLQPDKPLVDQMLTGAAFGAPLGLAGTAVAEGLGHSIFGVKSHPAIGELGLKGLKGVDGYPALNLYPSPGQLHNISVDPQEVARIAARQFGEASPPQGAQQLLAVRDRLGAAFETAAQKGAVATDGPLLSAVSAALADLGKKSAHKPIIRKLFDELNAEAQFGVGFLDGKRFLQLTAADGPIGKLIASADDVTRTVGKNLKRELEEALLRGTEAKFALANSSGNANAAAEAQQVLLDIQKARQQYKDFSIVRDIRDPTKGDFPPGALYPAVKDHTPSMDLYGAGEMEKLAELAKQFDPMLRKPENKWTLPYSGLAAVLSAIFQNPTTTGQAALAAAGTGAVGAGARKGISLFPRHVQTMLERSARVGKGPLQRNLQDISVPLVGAGGNLLFASPPPEIEERVRRSR